MSVPVLQDLFSSKYSPCPPLVEVVLEFQLLNHIKLLDIHQLARAPIQLTFLRFTAHLKNIVFLPLF